MSQTLKEYIDEYFENVSKYSLMYGGSLAGVESVWWTLMSFEAFQLQVPAEMVRDSFFEVMRIHKCSRCGLAGKAIDEKQLVEWLKATRDVFHKKAEEHVKQE